MRIQRQCPHAEEAHSAVSKYEVAPALSPEHTLFLFVHLVQ